MLGVSIRPPIPQQTEPLIVSQITVQVATLPIGRFLSAALPSTKFRLPGLGSREFSLNPGPFNMKEHVLISIFANAGSAFGSGSAYAISIINIIKAFYHRNISFFAGWILIITTQLHGLTTPEILKPDVIALGLNILAAWPDNVAPSGLTSDKRRTAFNILSGTSMACPHVSGLAALLKAAHPEWSPAAIRSALMTTAYTVDNRGETMLDESSGNTSTVMDYGAGHVHPERAMDPGLIYDLTSYDYVDFLCDSNYTANNIHVVTRKTADCSRAKRPGHPGNLNYPSMAAVFQQYGKPKMSTRFIRTVTNVGDASSVYQVKVRPPSGVTVTVHPDRLAFRRQGQKLNFLVRVEIRATKLSPGGSSTRSGLTTWSDGKRTVTSPLVVTLQQPL